MAVESYLAIFDVHFGYERVSRHKKPLHDDGALAIVNQFAADFKPDHVVLGGDILDCGAISHHNQGKPGVTEGLRLAEDVAGLADKLITPMEDLKPKSLRYITGNHECHDEATELLTQRGWLHYTEIEATDLAATVSRTTGHLEFLPVEAIVVKSYDGDMIHFKSQQMDALVTPGHRMWQRSSNDRSITYSFRPAGEMTASTSILPASAPTAAADYDISDAWIAICAWFIAEGWYSGGKYRYPNFSQRFDRLVRITQWLDIEGVGYTVRNRGMRTHVCGKLLKTFHDQGQISIPVAHAGRIRELVQSTKEMPEWVFRLSQRQLRIFLAQYTLADGSTHKNGLTAKMIYTSEPQLRDELLRLCVLAGFRASISEPRPGEWRINYTERQWIHARKHQIATVKYAGTVWCISTSNQTMITRRNGKVLISGNCWLDQHVEKFPALEGILDLKTLLHLDERWTVIPQGGATSIGKVHFVHGDQIRGGENVAKAAVLQYQRNIRFGHHHSYQVFTNKSALDLNGHTGVAVPCLCHKGPGYGKGAPNKWIQGFLWGYVDTKAGMFTDYVTVIVNGKTIINGRTYKS